MQILSCVIACWSFFDGCIKLRQHVTIFTMGYSGLDVQIQRR